MSVGFELAGGDALAAAVGYALLAVLGFTRLGRANVRTLGLSYLVGWSVLGCALSVLLIAGAPFAVATDVIAASVIVAGCVVVRRRWPVEALALLPRSKAWLAWLASALGGLVVGSVVVSTAVVASTTEWNPAGDWDATWFWIPKAASIYYAHGLDPAAWRTLNHPEYPPLIPVMDALTFSFGGGFHPSLIMVQQTLLGISFLLAALALLTKVIPSWIAYPSVAVVATAPWFFSRIQTPMPDQTVAYLVTAGAIASLGWLHDGRRRWLILALVFLAAASLSKLEGGFWSAALALVVIAVGIVVHRRQGLVAAILLAPLALIELWRAWLTAHGLRTSNPDYSLTSLLHPSFLAGRTARLSYATTAVAHTAEHLLTSAAGPGPVMVPLIAAVALATRRRPAVAVAAVAWTLLAGMALLAIYWIGRPSIVWYFDVTGTRVEPTFVAAALILSALVVGLAIQTDTTPRQPRVLQPRQIWRPLDRLATVLTHRDPRAAGALGTVAAILVGLGVFVIADARPTFSRNGAVDVGALNHEIVSQFLYGFLAGGYPLTAHVSCRSSSADNLQFGCFVTTTNRAHPSEEPAWNLGVTCLPVSIESPRCFSSNGEALQ